MFVVFGKIKDSDAPFVSILALPTSKLTNAINSLLLCLIFFVIFFKSENQSDVQYISFVIWLFQSEINEVVFWLFFFKSSILFNVQDENE